MMKLIFKYLSTAVIGFLVIVFSAATINFSRDTPPKIEENNLINVEGVLEKIKCSDGSLEYIKLTDIKGNISLATPIHNIKFCDGDTPIVEPNKNASIRYYKANNKKIYAYEFTYNGVGVFDYKDSIKSRSSMKTTMISMTSAAWMLLILLFYKYWRKET